MTISTLKKDPNPVTSPTDGSQTNTDQWNKLIDILDGVSSDKANMFTSIDDSITTTMISGSITSTLKTYTGKGWLFIDIAGDGDAYVEMRYSKDGATDVVISTSDQKISFGVGFNTSLVIKAKNTNIASKNASTVNSSGIYQP